MNIEKVTKDSFCVIGKVGSTNEGEGFVEKLWNDANSNFNEVSNLAKVNEDGNIVGIWGIMTNFVFDFAPWEDNFTKGLYLAGVEVDENAIAPKGWKKWIVPGFEYLKVYVEGEDTFTKMLSYMKENKIELVGAVQDYTDPMNNENYMMFPIAWNDSKIRMIRKIKDRTNPVSVCTHHCEYCFLGQWCGGCRSACNMCSMASMNEDNICDNVRCANEKGYNSCSKCDEILECKKGFYGMDTGYTPKATALFVKKYGEVTYSETLKNAIEDGVNYVKDFDDAGSVEDILKILEKYRNN